MSRQTATPVRRLSPRAAGGAFLRSLGGTNEQLLRPGPGRQRG